jgi:hypothetical protein
MVWREYPPASKANTRLTGRHPEKRLPKQDPQQRATEWNTQHELAILVTWRDEWDRVHSGWTMAPAFVCPRRGIAVISVAGCAGAVPISQIFSTGGEMSSDEGDDDS